MASGEDLIDVRPDERLDIMRLADYLEARVEGAEGTPTVRQFSGGHANLTYLLTYPGAEYVLRRPPRGPVAPGAHDMEREHGVLEKLWAAFPPAPRSLFYCADDSVIGAPFFLMERKSGVVVRKEVPAEFGQGEDPRQNRKLSEVVIDTMVAFHHVDPAAAGLATLGRPEGFLERQVEGWTRRWHAAAEEQGDDAEALIAWLRSHLPRSNRVTLVHNDWRLDNMAVHPADPGRCVAVYDWDMCTRGDPLADLGTTLAVWYDRDEEPSELNPMPTTTDGWMTRADAIERYAAATDVDPSDVGYYVVFGSFKMAVILQQIYIRWARGQTRDERFATMGGAARRLLRLAEQRAG